MNKYLLIIILLLTAKTSLFSQSKYDFGFENGNMRWIVKDNNNNVNISSDTTRIEGNYSLSIKPSGKANLLVACSVDFLGQKGRVEISYDMRKESASQVNIPILFLQLSQNDVRIKEMETIDVADGWTNYRMSTDVADPINKVVVGFMYHGEENILVDNFKVKVNGIEVDSLLSALYFRIHEDKEFDAGSGIDAIVPNKKNIEKLTKLCRIWGLLKYYHPNVAKGDYNWDYELFRIMPLLLDESSDFDAEIIRWIDKVGVVKANSDNTQYIDNELYRWIYAKNISNALREKLATIITSANNSTNYYVSISNLGSSFSNEKPYLSPISPDCGYRLLGLFRAWNIIEYFFPYKHLTDRSWDLVLKDFIPQFISANNSVSYGRCILKFSSQLCDCHTFVAGSSVYNTLNQLGLIASKHLPIEPTVIDGKIVVKEISDNEKMPLLVGDVITHIDGSKVEKLMEKQSEYFSYSNEVEKWRILSSRILNNFDKDSVLVRWQRDKKYYESYILTRAIDNNIETIKKSHEVIGDDIGYINVGNFKIYQCDSVMNIFKNKKGIVLDMRQYPQNFTLYKMGEFFMPEPKNFVEFRQTSIRRPGIYNQNYQMPIGKNNSDYYKGKIVLLVNERTISSGEFTTMGWSVAPNSVVIGSQTAGADGDLTNFAIPGGYIISFSGIGIYYPDGGQTQRVGVRIDEIVKPTIKGIREGRDEVLERAIEIINSK